MLCLEANLVCTFAECPREASTVVVVVLVVSHVASFIH